MPKKYVETPRSAGSAAGSTSSETHRWASARLAKAARTLSSSSWPACGTDRNAWTPVASSRPSTRRARSVLARGRGRDGPGRRRITGGGVDDDDLVAQPGAGAADPLLGAHRVGPAPGDPGRQPGQGLEGGRSARAVGGHADVVLELAHRALGHRAEPPVDAAGLEAELEQLALQGDHVVAGLHAAGQVHQDAVAEAPVRLLERAVGRRPTTPSALRPRCCWKARTARSRAASYSAGSPRLAAGISSSATSRCLSCSTSAPGPRAGRPRRFRSGRGRRSSAQPMKSASSLRIADFGRAPTICLTTSPWW